MVNIVQMKRFTGDERGKYCWIRNYTELLGNGQSGDAYTMEDHLKGVQAKKSTVITVRGRSEGFLITVSKMFHILYVLFHLVTALSTPPIHSLNSLIPQGLLLFLSLF